MENAQVSNLILKRASGKYHFETSNEKGLIVTSDADPTIGGTDLGVRPMEMLLASLASCSTIDIVLIMEKQRQNLEHIEVEITGTKEKRETYSIFSDIHLHFRLYGMIKQKKAEREVASGL